VEALVDDWSLGRHGREARGRPNSGSSYRHGRGRQCVLKGVDRIIECSEVESNEVGEALAAARAFPAWLEAGRTMRG